jgi:hypothetical protein
MFRRNARDLADRKQIGTPGAGASFGVDGSKRKADAILNAASSPSANLSRASAAPSRDSRGFVVSRIDRSRSSDR